MKCTATVYLMIHLCIRVASEAVLGSSLQSGGGVWRVEIFSFVKLFDFSVRYKLFFLTFEMEYIHTSRYLIHELIGLMQCTISIDTLF
jgi:hypothetical protein